MLSRVREVRRKTTAEELVDLRARARTHPWSCGTFGAARATNASRREVEAAEVVRSESLTATHAPVDLGGEPECLRERPERRENGCDALRVGHGLDLVQRELQRRERAQGSAPAPRGPGRARPRRRPPVNRRTSPASPLPEPPTLEVLHGVEVSGGISRRRSAHRTRSSPWSRPPFRCVPALPLATTLNRPYPEV